MASLLLPLHLLAAGLWAGCVLTEIAFERRLAGDAAQRPLLAALHRQVDLWIEAPAFALVALTGVLLWARGAPADGWLQAKLALGGMAVLSNLGCMGAVLARDQAARRGDAAAWERADRLQHALGGAVVLGLCGALALGLVRWGLR